MRSIECILFFKILSALLFHLMVSLQDNIGGFVEELVKKNVYITLFYKFNSKMLT